MKLGFEETRSPYESPSQSARAWTERWVRDWVYCPNCGQQNIYQFPRNRPVAGFFCRACNEEYELKSVHSNRDCRVKLRTTQLCCQEPYLGSLGRFSTSVSQKRILQDHLLARYQRKPSAVSHRRFSVDSDSRESTPQVTFA